MDYILYFFRAALPWMMTFSLVYIPCRLLYLQKSRQRAAARELPLFLFCCFLVGITSQTVLCSLPSFSLSNIGKRLSLTPGAILRRMRVSPYSAIIGFWGNLFLLMPLGFLAPMVFRRTGFFSMLLGGGLLSLSYELMQLPLDRSTDIDDLLLNTAGVMLGYFLFLLWKRLFRTHGIADAPKGADGHGKKRRPQR